MRVFAVHPGPLMYTKIFLRLEPLGLELVAAAAQQAGHEVRLIDLQVEDHLAFFRLSDAWRPDVILFSCNYLANIPEIVDLAKAAKARLPRTVICVGGHSASFVAKAILEHGEGAIDCVLRGEGEAGVPPLLAAIEAGTDLATVPGAVTASGEGPPPSFVHSLDELLPARDLLRHRRKYFIGVLDPCASIEFSRGCPWDCSFCSAWTFYGRSYRLLSPERVVEDLRQIRERGIFIVDDVAFVHERHGMELGEAIAQAGIKKRYYLETRGDVLLRNKDVFRFWKELGVAYMFLGLEAIDEDGLKKYRKRVPLGRNFEALEFARSLGVHVAVNLIADPDWDREHIDWHDIRGVAGISARLLMRGQTNFVKSLFKLNSVYRPEVLLADHMKPVKYEIPLPPPAPSGESAKVPVGGRSLYVHAPRGRAGRAIDAATERFVDETRMGATP